MPKSLQYFLAFLYVALVLAGIVSVLLASLHGIWLKIFLATLGIAIVGYLVILRKEEDEEIKSN